MSKDLLKEWKELSKPKGPYQEDVGTFAAFF